MWEKIKKTINTTLGKSDFLPLDKILDYEEYFKMYMSVLSTQIAGDTTLKALADCEGSKIYKSSYMDNNYYWKDYAPNARWFLLAPWVEEMQGSVILQAILPPKLKKINRDGAFSDFSYDLQIPPSVEEIHDEAFKMLYYAKVYIYNKKGAISGEPWGHQKPENIIYMYE